MDITAIKLLMEQHGWLYALLRGMPGDLLGCWEICRYQPKDIVCEQGEEPACFHILTEGELKVEHAVTGGHIYTLAHLHPGQLLGDLELTLEVPYVSRVSAVVKCELLALRADVYRKWARSDAVFLTELNRILASKLHATSQKTIENTYMSSRQMLLRHLYGLIEHCDFNAQMAYTAAISREDIARRLGVTVRSVNRILKELKERRIIFVSKNRIILNEWSRYMMERELQKGEQ
ncbi:Crp/Fnr family transcriptional regulator [Paenibacillus hamazuiensis]|uniref:Crp/Fnr family transcriptional regulator n=1 Tax=Paenibacillus hamazuiensis TaxID=2936508 RepID=UPI00200F6507|nr:Crp/Fnr family transcriptional regulator [Paenibacillus hamazuiensis]